MQDKSIIIRQTDNWVRNVVAGLNLCPFARKELETNRVHYQQACATAVEEVLHELVEEFQRLDQSPSIETTLFILAEGFEDFDDYLDMLELASELLVEQDYEGIYQLASFHPDYQFSGSTGDDPANYTNRSPYPMFHIIREASLEKALATFPDPESIPEKNIALCHSMGLEKMQSLLHESLKTEK